MCIICGSFISKNSAVKVSLWICCKILSKGKKKVNIKYPLFLKRKAIFHPKVHFILLWHLLTLIKNLYVCAGAFLQPSWKNFQVLKPQGCRQNWRGFDGVWGEITKLKPISASEGDSCVIVLNWGCLWVLSASQHQLQRLHCPSMTSICIYININVCTYVG